MTFQPLGLSAPILKAIQEEGYTTPTPVQEKAIPSVLEGRDVMAAAQTGTGKTAGFTLPVLERLSRGQRIRGNQARALILTPTRELAMQVAESVETYGRHLPLKSAVVYGGVKINPQMMKLRGGVDVLVATPGRLLDLYQQNAIQFKHLEILVLDEADRMLDMGFIRDIRKIIALLPAKRQNLLFSATFSDEIRALAKSFISNPIEFSVTPRNASARTVEQRIYPVDKKRKPHLLRTLIEDNNWQQVLVFSRTKAGANRLTRFLEESGIKAMAIHGNKSQGARTKALSEFKSGTIRVLVATDIAARGIDIDQLPQVVNVDLPNVAEDYVHRIGRTGRAGATGHAISLVCADEIKQLTDIERLIQKIIPRTLIDGFEPVHDVPESPALKPLKAKRPKKVKASTAESSKSSGEKPASQKRRQSNSDGAPSQNKRAKPARGNRPSRNSGDANTTPSKKSAQEKKKTHKGRGATANSNSAQRNDAHGNKPKNRSGGNKRAGVKNASTKPTNGNKSNAANPNATNKARASKPIRKRPAQ